MTPTPEVAILCLAVSQLLVPLLNGLLARRATKHEQAADQVPLLVQRMETVAADVRDIKAELRRVGEHESMLKLVDLRLKALEDWMLSARPQLHQVANHVQVLMGEYNARRMQHAANVVAAKDAGRTGP
ncbi:hypothetical protein JY651_07985 [Pyxidicoccus parkwayensis]|uniref:Uncharacterized protein n=1 Tax=Pyxidicoccus parkwayensis TaxID=2813578 RepID=A0ABX7P342_9BACT|nr:hypothetical protein [Pyxidicoccus parkwaysis]QSQ24869.1 hypothetical protein JY651_07985 [Pyxidicoccus parkwaysis]